MLRRSCLVFIPFFLIIQLDYIVQTAVLVKVMGPGHEFSFYPPYIVISIDITGFNTCCVWLWLSAFDAHWHVSVYVLLQFQCREWILFSVLAGTSYDLEHLTFLYIRVCPLLQCLSVYSVSIDYSHLWPFTLPALWCPWQWLFVGSLNHFFQKVVFEVFIFIFNITRSIIVLNIADLFQGGNLN